MWLHKLSELIMWNSVKPLQSIYLPQSPNIGPAPAARASLPSSVNPYAIVPVPAIRTHPWSFPIVPLARAATASFSTNKLTFLGNISLTYKEGKKNQIQVNAELNKTPIRQ